MTRSPDSLIPFDAGPREKACHNIRHRIREAVRSYPSKGPVGVVIQKLNPILNGWCTYFRVGNSNRTFHKVDGAVGASCSCGFGASTSAPGGLLTNDGDTTSSMTDVRCIRRWGRRVTWKDCGASRRTKMIGQLDAGKPPVQFDEGAQETCDRVTRLCPTLPPSPEGG